MSQRTCSPLPSSSRRCPGAACATLAPLLSSRATSVATCVLVAGRPAAALGQHVLSRHAVWHSAAPCNVSTATPSTKLSTTYTPLLPSSTHSMRSDAPLASMVSPTALSFAQHALRRPVEILIPGSARLGATSGRCAQPLVHPMCASDFVSIRRSTA